MDVRGELESKGVIVNYPDCYLVRQAMPYPAATSNSYLVEVDSGWAIIDVGVDLPSTRQLWAQVLQAVGISWSRIKAIYITHCHPDHLGAAAWMQQMTDAPVYMLDLELERAERFIFLNGDFAESYQLVAGHEMMLQGFGADKSRRLVIDWRDEVRPLYPKPEWVLTLTIGQEINLAGVSYQVVALPGHTDGQIGLWSKVNSRLFSADLVAAKGGYLHFTDWPNTCSLNPLGDMLRALDLVAGLEATELFPGHGLKIDHPGGVIDQLRQRHLKMLSRVHSLLQTSLSAAEMYRHLIKLPEEEYIHYHRVSLGEALGYMRYLEATGQANSYHEDGVLKFNKELNK